MTKLQKIQLEQSERREAVNAALAKDELNDEERTKLAADSKRLQELEVEYRAAITAEGETEPRQTGEGVTLDSETRERVELRGRCSVGRYLQAAARGQVVSGAEAELAAAAGVEGGIPLELWEPDPREARSESEARAITPAPSTVGVNLDPIRPAVFAASIAPRLGIEMPRVGSGTFATATVTTNQTAKAKAKSGAITATAGGLTVSTATPRRIAARLELSLEDRASVGQQNWEAILRQNLSLALSAQLDHYAINGTRANNASGDAAAVPKGMFTQLGNAPTDPSAVADFDAFAAEHAGGVDGLWAADIKQVGIVVGPATYVLASKTFQAATNYKGELSAAAYAMANTGGFWCNSRMPDAASNIQQAILYRMGRSMAGGSGAMRTAVMPHWGSVGIDDIYSGSAKGERAFTFHVLVGDVLVVQPGAYARVSFKLA